MIFRTPFTIQVPSMPCGLLLAITLSTLLSMPPHPACTELIRNPGNHFEGIPDDRRLRRRWAASFQPTAPTQPPTHHPDSVSGIPGPQPRNLPMKPIAGNRVSRCLTVISTDSRNPCSRPSGDFGGGEIPDNAYHPKFPASAQMIAPSLAVTRPRFITSHGVG